MHFDLDPTDDTTFSVVREGALIVGDVLRGIGMTPFVKTTGSRGVHIYVAIRSGPTQHEVWEIAKEIGHQIARAHPDVLTAEYRVAKRPPNRVLVDYNQNAFGKTLASIYSVRPNEAATVSTPVTWDELEAGCEPGDFTIFNVPERIARVGDLWKPLLSSRGRFDLAVREARNIVPRLTHCSCVRRSSRWKRGRSQRIPEGDDWSYEPKWDGFRCIAFRDGNDVELQSKSGESLTRYFPEIVAALQERRRRKSSLSTASCIVAGGDTSDFDALLQRIHPAESRVRRLARGDAGILRALRPARRRPQRASTSARCARAATRLEAFVQRNFAEESRPIRLSPATRDVALAQRWLGGSLARLDGVIAKTRRALRLRQPRCGRQDQAAATPPTA